jgi:hypothetical protein
MRRKLDLRKILGADFASIPSSADVARAEQRQFPGIGSLIVADEIRIAVCAPQFEVPVLGREPGVNHLGDVDATVPKDQRVWRLLAAMACVALDTNREELLLRHPITERSGTGDSLTALAHDSVFNPPENVFDLAGAHIGVE